MKDNTLLMVGMLAAAAVHGAAADGVASAAPLGAEPGPALVLQFSDNRNPGVTIGPAPEAVGGVWSWPAAGLVNSAQGALSFRVRLKPEETAIEAKSAPSTAWSARTVAAFTGTGGGEWFLSLWENPYVPPAREGKTPVAPDSVLNETAPAAAAMEALETRPEATVAGRAGLMLRGPKLSDAASFRADVAKRGQWRHVVWTWNSVEHRFTVDGKPAGGGSALSRLQPPADTAKAILRIAGGDSFEIADLRLYRRALTDAEAAALATAKPEQHLLGALAPALRAEWGRFSGRAIVYASTGALHPARLALRFTDGTGGLMREGEITRFPDGLGEDGFQVTENERAFEAGAYRVEGEWFDAAGTSLGTAHSDDWTAQALEAPYSDYLGCRAGAEDRKLKIIPPYEPIAVEDGATLRVSMRRHRLDRTGLPASIVAAGEEILGGPVTLHATSGGADIDLRFDGGSGLGPLANREDEAEWTSETATGEGHRLRVAGRLEYDGVMRLDVRLDPARPLDLDALEVRIPLRVEIMDVVHSIGSSFVARFGKLERGADGRDTFTHLSWNTGSSSGPARPETGAVFDAFFNHNADWHTDRVGSFVHVGNARRGLSWFIDNDEGWIGNPKAPNFELVATEAARYLRLNIVARPTKLTGPLAFRFYLLANPFKPLPEDWRTWTYYQRVSRLEKRSERIWFWRWSEYAKSFYPYPENYEKWRGKFIGSDVIQAPFVNYSIAGGSHLSGAKPNDALTRPDGRFHSHRPSRDYFAYWIDQTIRDVGIRGVYVDEPYTALVSLNLLASDVPYVAADGTRRLGFKWREGRAWFRRLKQVFVDNGVTDGGVWAHTSRWKGLPMFTFLDISMDGEWPAIWVDSFYDYTHWYSNPELNRAYTSGQAFGFVGTQMYNGNFNKKKTWPYNLIASRSFLGVTLPYGVIPYPPHVREELHRAHHIQMEAGVFEHDAIEEVLPFQNGAFAGGGFLNRKRNVALLYALRRTRFFEGGVERTGVRDGPRALEMDARLSALPLEGAHRHAWHAESGMALATAHGTELELDPTDYAPILVRGADAPQPARAPGEWLRLDFESAPAAIPGLFAVAPTGTPVFVEGRAGRGFAVRAGSELLLPVVPPADSGALEFDLRATALPVTLIRLRHRLHADLRAVAAEGGGIALELEANEGDAKRNGRFALAPAAADAWRRVRLEWRAGHYEIFCDGRALGGLRPPAAPPMQDDAFPAFGLALGDAGTRGEAAIDNLVVRDSAESGAKAGMRVWVWGREPDVRVAVHFADLPERDGAQWVTVTAHEDGRLLGSGAAMPFQGYARIALTPPPPATPGGPGAAGGPAHTGGADDFAGEFLAEIAKRKLTVAVTLRDGENEKAGQLLERTFTEVAFTP